jgi:hypothetical protein
LENLMCVENERNLSSGGREDIATSAPVVLFLLELAGPVRPDGIVVVSKVVVSNQNVYVWLRFARTMG